MATYRYDFPDEPYKSDGGRWTGVSTEARMRHRHDDQVREDKRVAHRLNSLVRKIETALELDWDILTQDEKDKLDAMRTELAIMCVDRGGE